VILPGKKTDTTAVGFLVRTSSYLGNLINFFSYRIQYLELELKLGLSLLAQPAAAVGQPEKATCTTADGRRSHPPEPLGPSAFLTYPK
jgi:hypothetical protein